MVSGGARPTSLIITPPYTAAKEGCSSFVPGFLGGSATLIILQVRTMACRLAGSWVLRPTVQLSLFLTDQTLTVSELSNNAAVFRGPPNKAHASVGAVGWTGHCLPSDLSCNHVEASPVSE